MYIVIIFISHDGYICPGHIMESTKGIEMKLGL